MNSSTRITRSKVVDLCETIHAANPDLPAFGGEGAGAVPVRAPDTDIPEAQPVPGACRRGLRRVSQATASRVVTVYTPLIARALEVSVPTVEDLDPTVQLIVDGTLLQCWSWADHPELYSGKHQTTGVNVQVACTLSGTLAWVSDPPTTEGSTTPRPCAAADCLTCHRPTSRKGASPPQHIGDKGYIGLGMITPKRKPANLPLYPDDKAYNTTVNQVRYRIERVIANIKTWRVLHTGYRRPLETFPETITAILGIIFTYTL